MPLDVVCMYLSDLSLVCLVMKSRNMVALAKQSIQMSTMSLWSAHVLQITTIRSRRAMIENVVVTPTAKRMYASDSSTVRINEIRSCAHLRP